MYKLFNLDSSAPLKSEGSAGIEVGSSFDSYFDPLYGFYKKLSQLALKWIEQFLKIMWFISVPQLSKIDVNLKKIWGVI